MKKSILALALCGVCGLCGLAGGARAGCSQEELQAKVTEFTGKAQQLAQKDPKKYQEVGQEMAKELPALQQGAQSGDVSKICEFYDAWNAKLK